MLVTLRGHPVRTECRSLARGSLCEYVAFVKKSNKSLSEA